MAVDPELEELFVDTVDIAPFIGADFDRVDSHGPPVTFKAHISAKTEQVLRDTGDVAVSTHRIVLTERATIGEKDLITMPVRFSITNPEIMSVLEFVDETGPHHTTILIAARKGASN